MSFVWWAIVVLLLTAGVLTAYAGWRGAPFVPTPTRAVDAALVMAAVRPGDTFVDFGAGDGRVVIAAARRGARAIGYELSPFLWLVAWVRLLAARSPGTVVLRDVFHVDLSRATVLFLFLVPRTLGAVAEHLRGHLRPGTRVVTYAFPLPGWAPDRVENPPRCGTLRLYTVPGH